LTTPFFKYQGTGNDFIVIDDLNRTFPSTDIELIKNLCDRKFGIGSDGILLLQSDEESDFYLDFINPDGSRSFCGNGSRCAVRFIELKMSDVSEVKNMAGDIFIDTGSPHHMVFRNDVKNVDVKKDGGDIRFNEHYKEIGVNVNFVAKHEDGIFVRTYERGVEDETLSCGTGVTASALAYSINSGQMNDVKVKTLGGNLIIKFVKSGNGFKDIWLCGPAEKVFEGKIEL